MNVGLTKTYRAGADVGQRLLVKLSTGTVVPAAAATDAIIGVSTDIDVASGQPCDVIHDGIVIVKAGAAVTEGAQVTSDAAGKAVPAADKNRVLGVALEAAAALDDLISVLIDLGSASI